MNNDFYDRLVLATGRERVFINEPMKKHTTFRAGGPASYLVMPQSPDELQKVMSLCDEEGMPRVVIGNGSNLLVCDDGYRGVIIKLCRDMGKICISGAKVCAQAGAFLSGIGNMALEAGLSGFEFLSGIPGTVGGAVVMNAGAYGGEIKDILGNVTVLTKENVIRIISNEEMGLGYRTSLAEERGWTVLEAEFLLKKGDRGEIRKKMDELKARRAAGQPLNYPSAGSTFKRPAGNFAGKLIQDAGLAGYHIGDAEVSRKHCGFVINKGNATAEDIFLLIRHVTGAVKEKTGVQLEPEVKFLGF